MNRRALLGICLAALSGLTACPGPNDCVTPPTGASGTGGGNDFVFGDSAEVSWQAQVPTAACEGVPQPESAKAEVYDPLNRLVEHTLVFRAAPTPGAPATAQVTFTPPVPGYYHLSVAFEPVGGREQLDVLVVHDREATAPVTLNTTAGCGVSVFPTPSGTYVCDSTAYFPGGAKQALSSGGISELASVKGDVAWLHRSFTLRRMNLTSTSATQSPDASIPLTVGIDSLYPLNDDEVAAISGTDVLYIRTDGGVTRNDGPQSQSTARAIASNGLLYVSETLLDESTESTGNKSHICAVSTRAPYSTADAGCWNVPGDTVGSGRDGLWTWSDTTSTLRLAAPGPDGGLFVIDALQLSKAFELRAGPQIGINGATRPTLSRQTGASPSLYVPRRDGDRIVLDRFGSDQLGFGTTAQDDLLWVSASNGQVLIWPIP